VKKSRSIFCIFSFYDFLVVPQPHPQRAVESSDFPGLGGTAASLIRRGSAGEP